MSCVIVSRFKCPYALCHCCLVLIIILFFVVIAFYVLWQRSRFYCFFMSLSLSLLKFLQSSIFFLLWCVYVVSRVCVHVMSFTVLRHDCHRVLIFIMSCVSAHKLTVFLSCVTDVLCSCVDVCVCFFSVSSWQY